MLMIITKTLNNLIQDTASPVFPSQGKVLTVSSRRDALSQDFSSRTHWLFWKNLGLRASCMQIPLPSFWYFKTKKPSKSALKRLFLHFHSAIGNMRTKQITPPQKCSNSIWNHCVHWHFWHGQLIILNRRNGSCLPTWKILQSSTTCSDF